MLQVSGDQVSGAVNNSLATVRRLCYTPCAAGHGCRQKTRRSLLMQVGVGLPNGLPGADGQLLVEWARRADQGPFTSLGVVDRLVYGSHDPMLSLAAAAA